MNEIRKKICPGLFDRVEPGWKIAVGPEVREGCRLILEEHIEGRYPPFSSKYTGRVKKFKVKEIVHEDGHTYAVVG